ncbi:MAG: hypothetical protein NT007_10545 [Candidatus Kapabacteria bacterium]|nr:hypothetical protein [Candidatus Kapabacteria bacterium]
MKNILFLLTSLLFLLSGCFTIYKDLSVEDKLLYKLENINIIDHESQSDTLIYSIDSKNLKQIMKNSKKKYQLILLYSLTCSPNKYSLDDFMKYIPKLYNTQIYLVSQNDQVFKENYYKLKNIPYKRYMLNSDIYSSSTVDAISQSYDAKYKFTNEICSSCKIDEASFALLFDREGNILFYTNQEYNIKYWKKDLPLAQYIKDINLHIYNDIANITNK